MRLSFPFLDAWAAFILSEVRRPLFYLSGRSEWMSLLVTKAFHNLDCARTTTAVDTHGVLVSSTQHYCTPWDSQKLQGIFVFGLMVSRDITSIID